MTNVSKFRSEYNSWRDAVRRCTNQEHPKWEYYGGRGITVCERWLHSFENFLADMGPKPTSKHTIERRDNAGNYEPPPQCYWATRKEQANNRRSNRQITINGRTKTLQQWADATGVSRDLILSRLRLGLTPEDAIGKPVGFYDLTDEEKAEIIQLGEPWIRSGGRLLWHRRGLGTLVRRLARQFDCTPETIRRTLNVERGKREARRTP